LVAVVAVALAVVAQRPALPEAAAQPEMCGPVDRGWIGHGETVNGAISDCHREEIWTFEGVEDQVVIIRMARPSPPTFEGLDMDPVLRLLAPSREGPMAVEAENDDGGLGVDAQIQAILSATGQYRIVATAFEGAIGDYTLSLFVRGVSPANRGEIQPGETVGGRIDPGNPEEVWWFEGRAGQRVLISMRRVRPITLESITLDPLLFLMAPERDGHTNLVEDEDDDGGDEFDALIVRVLERTGWYGILATSLDDTFGEYVLTLQMEDVQAGPR
jgi:hypothetical protein